MNITEYENFKPHFFIATGKDDIMYTLRYRTIGWTKVEGVAVPYVRTEHHANLSTDYEKAVAKAKEKAGDNLLILEGAKDTNEWGSGSSSINTTVQVDYAWLEEQKRREEELEEARRIEREAYEKAEPVPVTYSRIKFTGVVLGNKTVDTQWGRQTKSLFQDDRGFKIYGGYLAEKGDKISFEAGVTVSKDDEKFGFFKRATKVLEQGQDERDIKNYMFDFFGWGNSKYKGSDMKVLYNKIKIHTEENPVDWACLMINVSCVALYDLDKEGGLDTVAKKIEDKLGLDYLNS